ncbi:MAG: hypothetical protein M1829_003690 [Trizodia sp. TS-e1964]|nr:MAG: hypothetical protein M1829_003690 [Trizodia sp. TS-e1964]
MNKSLVDQALDEAKALGIRNVLALRGDPPRNDEYRQEGTPTRVQSDEEKGEELIWAVDLVRYIRKKHGDYFCIGVAAYPEGHADVSHPEKQSASQDLPYLVEKVKAGADFVMTQLFFDIQKYQEFETMLRDHPSRALKDIPIIPGLIPIQGYQILKRTTKLSHATLPDSLLERLDAIKGDDEAVKSVGVDIISEIIESIKSIKSSQPRGFHFYTLNLEKSVALILERCHLIPLSSSEQKEDDMVLIETSDTNGLAPSNGVNNTNARRRLSRRRDSVANSDPYNRVVVDLASSSGNSEYEAPANEAGLLKEKINTRANTLAISEGEGSLGREATWDDYPNGRWGDARSPAFGEIDGYGVSLHVSVSIAIKLWGHPTTVENITSIFTRHLSGELEAIPWSEESLNVETSTISKELLDLNQKGWWSVASQPAANGVRSSDPVFGWGPKNGFVFQKAFVEFFIPSSEWARLSERLAKNPEFSYYGGNRAGDFTCSDGDAVNAVTWGCFRGKEIITPTIIEEVSFRAWLEEAFGIWAEWQRVYRPESESASLLGRVMDDYWLVNVIHHGYLEKDALWDFLRI